MEKVGLRTNSLQLTRREMLAAMLGLPLALSACRNPEQNELPPGELIGASDRVGHRLRDGLRIEPAADNWQQVGVVIVGGGVAGLSAARHLLKSGYKDFVLLELEKVAGGTARSDQNSFISYPWGAHYIPAPMQENQPLVELFDEMGLLEGRDKDGEPIVAEQYLCREPEERIFYRGRWYEGLYLAAGASDQDRAEFKAFRAEVDRWVGWRDSRNRRAFVIPTALGSDDAEVTVLDKISMSDWLAQHGWQSPRLRWLIDYACRDDYGATIEQTSAWAGLFYFASRVTKPGVEAQTLVTWPEGNGRLVNHLYQIVKDQVKLGYSVCRIKPASDNAINNDVDKSSRNSGNSGNKDSFKNDRAGKGGVEVVAVDYAGQTAIGYRARRVIFAAPQFLTRYLIQPWRDNPPAHIEQFQYSAWMVANLTLKDRPQSAGFPLCWDNVLYESPSLGYVVATHQRGLDYGPTVFTYYYPLCQSDTLAARKKLLSIDRDGWADIALSDLGRAHPEIGRLTERLDVMRWGHAMVRPYPGFVWSGARAQAQQPFRGIHFANSDLSGIALFEEAFYHGNRAATEVLSNL